MAGKGGRGRAGAGRRWQFLWHDPNGGAGGAGTVFRPAIVLAAPLLQAATLTNRTLGLTWSTEAGGTYQPQLSSDLGSSNWANLGSAVTAAGAVLSATDPVTNGPRRFYRVALSP